MHQVRVLGEGFTPEDEEDSAAAEVSKVWAYQARYRVPLAKATAGDALDKYLIFVLRVMLHFGPSWHMAMACSVLGKFVFVASVRAMANFS